MATPEPTDQKAMQLVQYISQFDSVVVAFSGGVDSTVVCQAAALSTANVVAVTGDSPSVPSGEVANCQSLAYWCKSELYQQIETWIKAGLNRDSFQNSDWKILNGTNVDDLGDYRPGLKSADQHGVVSPLVECGIDKNSVRDIAKHWQLPVWNKPAGPCLASRIAPGEPVTPEKLQMIDAAERFLREKGFDIVRVRFHTGSDSHLSALTLVAFDRAA